jgi:predicted dehydrogenase
VSPVVGLVGCGRWGRHILRDLRSLGCAVPVVARSEASRERAREGGARAIVEHVSQLAGADGIVVATPTTTHAEVLEEALALGVPLFCEKPLAHDAVAASRLAERAPETIFVMDKWRYHPGVRELGAIAREQRLGRVSGIRTVRVGWGNPHDDVDPVWVLAPHDLAIALEVMGAVPRAETAVGLDLDGELAHLEAVLRGDAWWQLLEVSGRSPERTRRVELHCEDGVAVLAGGWDEHVSVFREGAEGPDEELVETPGELPLLAELRAFVAHLAGGPAPRTSVTDGAAIVAAVEELRRLALAQ